MTSPKHSASSGRAGPHTDNTESLLEGSDNEAKLLFRKPSCHTQGQHSTRSSRGLSAFPGKIDYTYLLESRMSQLKGETCLMGFVPPPWVKQFKPFKSDFLQLF